MKKILSTNDPSTETAHANPSATNPVQCKLTVGDANDTYEQEADAVAGKVMRMPDQNFIQRKCAHCEEEEKKELQRKPLSQSITTVQAKTGDGATVSTSVNDKINSSKGNGGSLDASIQSFMQNRMGADFTNVKIHTDSEAIQMSRELNAKAFTTGNDIYFNEGQYQPGSSEGKQLLAHELVHTVQQKENEGPVQRMIEVNPGVELDTMGYSVAKGGNLYTNSVVVKSSVYNELVTSLLNSDRTFKLAGSTTKEANANLKKHIAARIGIIDFAGKKKYTFAAGAGFTMNPDYWKVDHVKGSFDVKAGVDKQKAMDDLNVHPDQYAIACEAATAITMKGGSKSDIRNDSSELDTDWVPGDWGYIENTKFPRPGGTPGLEGENIIYVGKNKFWGHFGPGKEYKTLKEWFDQVNGWNSGAVISTQRKYPKAGLE
jgi:hypothetical protein